MEDMTSSRTGIPHKLRLARPPGMATAARLRPPRALAFALVVTKAIAIHKSVRQRAITISSHTTSRRGNIDGTIPESRAPQQSNEVDLAAMLQHYFWRQATESRRCRFP